MEISACTDITYDEPVMSQSVQMTEMNVQTRSKSESVFILTFQGLENKEIFATWYQGKIIEIWHQE